MGVIPQALQTTIRASKSQYRLIERERIYLVTISVNRAIRADPRRAVVDNQMYNARINIVECKTLHSYI